MVASSRRRPIQTLPSRSAIGACKSAMSGRIAGTRTTGSGVFARGVAGGFGGGGLGGGGGWGGCLGAWVPISPRIDAKGAPFWAAVRPAWTAGQVLSSSSIAPSDTARLKQGAPPASPRLTALVSMVRTRPAPISMSTCMPPVGTQTRQRSRGAQRISGSVTAMATPAYSAGSASRQPEGMARAMSSMLTIGFMACLPRKGTKEKRTSANPFATGRQGRRGAACAAVAGVYVHVWLVTHSVGQQCMGLFLEVLLVAAAIGTNGDGTGSAWHCAHLAARTASSRIRRGSADGWGLVGVTGDEGLAAAGLRVVDMPVDAADVAAVGMDADGPAVLESIGHAVDIPDRRRDAVDLAGPEHVRAQAVHGAAFLRHGEALAIFGSAQHADQRPHGVIVDRRLLARPPDEADDREALPWIAVQQVLAVVLRMRLRELGGQPVVARDQFGQQGTAEVQDARLIAVRIDEPGQCAAEGFKVGAHGVVSLLFIHLPHLPYRSPFRPHRPGTSCSSAPCALFWLCIARARWLRRPRMSTSRKRRSASSSRIWRPSSGCLFLRAPSARSA